MSSYNFNLKILKIIMKGNVLKERRERHWTTCRLHVPCHRHQDFYLGDISARVYDKSSLFRLE